MSCARPSPKASPDLPIQQKSFTSNAAMPGMRFMSNLIKKSSFTLPKKSSLSLMITRSYTIEMQLLIKLVLIAIATLISACSSQPSFEWEDTSNNDTIELYRSTAYARTDRKNIRLLNRGSTDLYSYSRTEADALATQFPLLNNPTFTLYVFPHIKDNIPIPGYITTFKLYQSDIFALPGER